MSSNRHGLVILISGSGTNLQAIIDAIKEGTVEADIRCVISNRADAYGLERARQAGIATRVVDHRQYDSRESFDAALQQEIDQFQPDLVVLAGFMRILTRSEERRVGKECRCRWSWGNNDKDVLPECRSTRL